MHVFQFMDKMESFCLKMLSIFVPSPYIKIQRSKKNVPKKKKQSNNKYKQETHHMHSSYVNFSNGILGRDDIFCAVFRVLRSHLRDYQIHHHYNDPGVPRIQTLPDPHQRKQVVTFESIITILKVSGLLHNLACLLHFPKGML